MLRGNTFTGIQTSSLHWSIRYETTRELLLLADPYFLIPLGSDTSSFSFYSTSILPENFLFFLFVLHTATSLFFNNIRWTSDKLCNIGKDYYVQWPGWDGRMEMGWDYFLEWEMNKAEYCIRLSRFLVDEFSLVNHPENDETTMLMDWAGNTRWGQTTIWSPKFYLGSVQARWKMQKPAWEDRATSIRRLSEEAKYGDFVFVWAYPKSDARFLRPTRTCERWSRCYGSCISKVCLVFTYQLNLWFRCSQAWA